MLNPGQQQAVRAAGHAMICACPGSGKTTVLKFRASHLLE
ncbi:UvrD-helicase domain-containing protein, partial [Xanthomonas hortorum pv. gardneri]